MAPRLEGADGSPSSPQRIATEQARRQDGLDPAPARASHTNRGADLPEANREAGEAHHASQRAVGRHANVEAARPGSGSAELEREAVRGDAALEEVTGRELPICPQTKDEHSPFSAARADVDGGRCDVHGSGGVHRIRDEPHRYLGVYGRSRGRRPGVGHRSDDAHDKQAGERSHQPSVEHDLASLSPPYLQGSRIDPLVGI